MHWLLIVLLSTLPWATVLAQRQTEQHKTAEELSRETDARTAKNEIPKTPTTEEDARLTTGKTAAAFFKSRQNDESCRADLKKVKGEFIGAVKELKKLVANRGGTRKIATQEETVAQKRSLLLRLMERCGECATREMEKRVIEGQGRTQVWYVLDGSCQLDIEDSAKLVAAFERMKKTLRGFKGFPAKNGGFSNCLEYVSVDTQTGALQPSVEMATRPSSLTFFSHGTRDWLLGDKVVINGLVRNHYADISSGGTKSFVMRFQSQEPPSGFHMPEVNLVEADGTKTLSPNQQLNSIRGMWYVNSKGYVRYYLAADVGISQRVENDILRKMHLNMLVELYERAAGD